MKAPLARLAQGLLVSALALSSSSCVERGGLSQDTFRLKVGLSLQDGSPLPGPENPLCLDLRGTQRPASAPPCPTDHFFKINVEAILPSGQRDTSFNRFVRISITPGTVVSVSSQPDGTGQGRADGRNILLKDGYAEGQLVRVVGSFGNARILAEDIGYQPGDPINAQKSPSCADGLDNDGDGLIDFPADPGCAFSNDDTEDSGTFAAGASPIIAFARPTVAEAQGFNAGTPFAQEGIVLETRAPLANVLVTRISNSGFYVSDVEPQTDDQGNILKDAQGNDLLRAKPYGSLFVFNFGLPEGVLVCDRMTYLSGTMDEFFGYTEMTFPSFDVEPFDTRPGAKTTNIRCLVPEPTEITPDKAKSSDFLEQYEAGLVRLREARVAAHLGPAFPQEAPFDLSSSFPCQGAKKYTFAPGASNCDFDRSGNLNFTAGSDEGLCACFCYQDPDCSEWSAFRGRGNYRVVLGTANDNKTLRDQTIQVNTGAIPEFNPVAHSGKTLRSITGTLANFSGGDLNWTLEARCPDDLVLCPEGQDTCTDDPPAGLSSQQACIGKRTAVDNDSASGN